MRRVRGCGTFTFVLAVGLALAKPLPAEGQSCGWPATLGNPYLVFFPDQTFSSLFSFVVFFFFSRQSLM